MVEAHLLLSLAALGTEASDWALLVLMIGCPVRANVAETFGAHVLQFVGQVMEDACTVLHRLEDRKGKVTLLSQFLSITL